MTFREAQQALGAEFIGGPPPESLLATSFPSVSIDTRSIQAGQCFVAIKGQRLDGHAFLEEAAAKGASAVVVSDEPPAPLEHSQVAVLKVANTVRGLQELARAVRLKWQKRVIAITGSMGKTTTRDFASRILSRRFQTHQSSGNLNNEIGLPLSLLALTSIHEMAVLELAMNHKGEIARLGEVCLPDAALVTNVAPVHLQFFASLEEIAEAKAEILRSLSPAGIFFFNADDPLVTRMRARYSGKAVSFGFSNEADVQVQGFELREAGTMQVAIRLGSDAIEAETAFAGRPFLYNLAAAVAVAWTFGVPLPGIVEGIGDLEALPGRGRLLRVDSITILDDSYNSNPRALDALLATVRTITGFRRKLLALGDMLELGTGAEPMHEQAGTSAANAGADWIVTVGPLARLILTGAARAGFPPARTAHFSTADEAAEFLRNRLEPGDLLVVKGSRGVAMDRIVRQLKGNQA